MVADKFHILRMADLAVDGVRLRVRNEIEAKRTKLKLMHDKYILKTRAANMEESLLSHTRIRHQTQKNPSGNTQRGVSVEKAKSGPKHTTIRRAIKKGGFPPFVAQRLVRCAAWLPR